ncbi:MAG: chondroitinase-B domain-containing protein [Bacteroidota bacterium]
MTKTFYFILLLVLIVHHQAAAERFLVSNLVEFNTAQDNANAGDSIVWQTGMYVDVYLQINKDGLYIGAESLGGTVFTGSSRVRMNSDQVSFEGFQYVGGNIGTNDVINIYGSDILVNEINIRAYTCYKYLRIRESSQYVAVTYCNFENRLNLDDQNILSILVNENQPGYHKIQYCSFKNFEGTGNDMGIEPIRIGLSTQANRISRSLVEYCYFTNCDGDGELISSKATQNVYRFNTFEQNNKAELVLRHGSEAIVYGNFFLNGKGGVRVREGQNHYIYNNYFFELDDRAIFLQNEDSDPLDNIQIAFNSIIDCSEVILGGDGDDPPTNVTLANNLFVDPDDDLFEDPTGNETWLGNIASGSLGMSLPGSGITAIDPLLVVNTFGYFELSAGSPAIDAAVTGFSALPQFPGMDPIDTDMLLDIMEQQRPVAVSDKDLGCSEFPQLIPVQPLVNEGNTGPSYNTSILTSVEEFTDEEALGIRIGPNPAQETLHLFLDLKSTADLNVTVIDGQGRMVRQFQKNGLHAGPQTISMELDGLAEGVFFLHLLRNDLGGRQQQLDTIPFFILR